MDRSIVSFNKFLTDKWQEEAHRKHTDKLLQIASADESTTDYGL
jgi:hypothetical protein